MPLFMSRSACLSANVPAEFLFVCWIFFFFPCRCVYGSGSASNNPLIVCHVQTPQFLGCVSVFFLLQLLLHVGAHVSVSVLVVWGFYFIFF